MAGGCSMCRSDKSFVCLGAFAGAHGLDGLVRVRTFTARPEAICDYGPVADEAGTRSFELSFVRAGAKGHAIVRVAGVTDRAAAEALKGVRFYVERGRLPATGDEDEFYHTDLIGLDAFHVDGRPMGRIRAVLDFGAGDLLDIGGGEIDIVVPFNKASVPEVDLADGRVVIDPPAGLVS